MSGGRHDQSRKPREGAGRRGAAGADAARLARVSGEGAQRGRRDGAAAVHQSERRADARHMDQSKPSRRRRSPRATSCSAGSTSACSTSRRLNERLSGLALEYRVVELFSRDRGAARSEAGVRRGPGHAGPGLPQRSEPAVRLRAVRRREVGSARRRRHADDRAVHVPRRRAAASIRPDRGGWRRISSFTTRSIASMAKSMLLPAGKYHVTYTRGPEYRVSERDIDVPGNGDAHGTLPAEALDQPGRCRLVLGRPSRARGRLCPLFVAHARRQPADMMRHILGEDLNVGCVLTWGPCWYHQKQFFDGKVHALSTPRQSDAVRRGSLRLSQLARRPRGPAAAEGRRLSGHEADRRMAELGPAGSQVGQGARRRGRLLAQRLGPGGAGARACRRTTCRRSTASAPTSTSST